MKWKSFCWFQLIFPCHCCRLPPVHATPLLLLRYASFWLRMQMGKIVYIYHSDRIGISIESGRHTHTHTGRLVEKGGGKGVCLVESWVRYQVCGISDETTDAICACQLARLRVCVSVICLGMWYSLNCD